MPYLKGVWWYDFQDDGWRADDKENNFGLVRPDLTPKPSYDAMASISGLVSQAEFVGRLETASPEIWALKFRTPNGEETIAIWSEGAEAKTLSIRGRSLRRTVEAGEKPILVTGEDLELAAAR